MTRYALLRESLAYFAASPEAQRAHDWGADDAVNDLPYPLEHMFDYGELNQAEIDRILPLDAMIERYCAQDGVKPWHDETALFTDRLWAEIRTLAGEILASLPDELRESDYTRSL